MSKLARVIRVLWWAPNSIAGVVLAGLVFASGNSLVFHGGGVVEYRGWLSRWRLRNRSIARGFPVTSSATTIGGTILIAVSDSINLATSLQEAWFMRLLAHEHVHVSQSKRWGILFFPAYLFCHACYGYLNNPFEVEAFRAEGSGDGAV